MVKMSLLQKQVLGGKLPPPGSMLPPLGPRNTGARVRGGGLVGPGARKRSYSPVSWEKYWDKKEKIETDRGQFVVYSRGEGDTLVLLLHGGGYSGLTWSLAAEQLLELASCRVAAMDLRGHGETVAGSEGSMSKDSLARDVRDVGDQLVQKGGHKHLVLVGHSMGGAVALAAAELEAGIAGLVVIDVVEGTALESLSHMQTFLRSRPQEFRSVDHAIEWCVRSGQVRNLQSARVSMPGQITDRDGRLASALVSPASESSGSAAAAGEQGHHGGQQPFQQDSILEEEEEENVSDNKEDEKVKKPAGPAGATHTAPAVAEQAAVGGAPVTPGGGPYRWAVDLAGTEPYWRGWFEHLSAAFLSVPTAKLLLLAGVDRLDRDLTVGQMQGKFQLIVLPQVGHAIHEDSPDKVGEVLAQFLVRNRLAETKDPALLPPQPSIIGLHP